MRRCFCPPKTQTQANHLQKGTVSTKLQKLGLTPPTYPLPGTFEDDFPLPRWDMLLPWRVTLDHQPTNQPTPPPFQGGTQNATTQTAPCLERPAVAKPASASAWVSPVSRLRLRRVPTRRCLWVRRRWWSSAEGLDSLHSSCHFSK